MLLPRRIAAQLQNSLPKEPERPASTTQIFYYHTDHLGTPRELTNTDGHIVWEARYQAWSRAYQVDYPAIPHVISDGNTQRQVWIEPHPHERPVQNLRFQGQYHDEETGLHYNRFRYYDPDVGRFASQDPIGLAGGVNTYQYAPNPVVWVDPLGLCKCPDVAPEGTSPPNLSPPGAGRRGALHEAKRQSGIPTSQQPSRVLPNIDKRGNPQPGRIYEYEIPAPGGGIRTVRIRDDAGGHNFGPSNSQNRGSHFNDEAKNHYDY